MPGQILLAHPGLQHARFLAGQLHRYGTLNSFHTCVAFSAESVFAKYMRPLVKALGLERQWENRTLDDLPPQKLRCYPKLEIEALWRLRQGASPIKVWRWRNDLFQRHIADGAFEQAQSVIGFDTSSHILGKRSHEHGKRFILDRSIGHPRAYHALQAQLRDCFPDWPDTHEQKEEHDLEIEDTEHEIADLIVAPSRFVANTLTKYGVEPDKIRINPYGVNLKSFSPASRPPANNLIKFLFVGSLTARKGLPLLLQAWRRLNPKGAELWIAGPGKVPIRARSSCANTVRWLGPVSRGRLKHLLREVHVFVFPSYFEGLATVLLEAAATGLPIVATNSSGAEEIVEDGLNGYIIKTGVLDHLAEAINRFLDRPSLAAELHENAKQIVGRFGLSSYGERWQQLLNGDRDPYSRSAECTN